MSEELARVLRNPLRTRLLLEYQDRPTSPSRLARRLNEPVSLVSYHTEVLVRHRCVELVRTERRRGATEHFYRGTIGTIVEDEDWARLPRAVRRALTLSDLEIATGEARQAALEGGFDGARAHLSCLPMELDEAGLVAVSELLRRTLHELHEIQVACRARAGDELEPYEVVMLSFARASAPEPPDGP